MDDSQIAIHGKWVIRLEMGARIGTKATWHTDADTTCTNYLGIYGRGYHETVLMEIMGALITTGGLRWTLCIWRDLIGRGSMNVDDEQHTGNR
jgi:hypothetical protein